MSTQLIGYWLAICFCVLLSVRRGKLSWACIRTKTFTSATLTERQAPRGTSARLTSSGWTMNWCLITTSASTSMLTSLGLLFYQFVI